jgi:hypothetical protein
MAPQMEGRVVFRGNDVVDENCDAVVFQELGSAPGTMVAAKFCDVRSLLRDRVNENNDPAQAYARSLLGGTETWVSLPCEEWPEFWNHMKRPARPLVTALCGHPDAGGYWEQHCDNHFKDCGFNLVAQDDRAWRSCYFSLSLKCYMIAYVGDFKFSGPHKGVTEAWVFIRGENPRTRERGIGLDDPTPAGKFLGCNRKCAYVWAPPMHTHNGSIQPLEGVRNSYNATVIHYAAIIPGAEMNAQGDPVSGVCDPTAGNMCYKQMKYDMSDFLGSCVRLCQELTST